MNKILTRDLWVLFALAGWGLAMPAYAPMPKKAAVASDR